MTGHWIGIAEEAIIADLTAKLAECQAREAKLRDFAQWLTGCCDLTQYDYFLQNRHILAEQPDDTALKEYRKKVLLEAAGRLDPDDVVDRSYQSWLRMLAKE